MFILTILAFFTFSLACILTWYGSYFLAALSLFFTAAMFKMQWDIKMDLLKMQKEMEREW